MNTERQNNIESTPTVLRGKPRIKGTRIPVSLILGYLAAGKSSEQIIEEFPDLLPEHIAACLDYARELAKFEVARCTLRPTTKVLSLCKSKIVQRRFPSLWIGS